MGMTELETLKYITESPAQEDGGFHPNTVAAAKWAVAEIAELRQIINGLIKTCDHEHEWEGNKCKICQAIQITPEEMMKKMIRGKA